MIIQKDLNSLNFTGERLVTKINEYWTLEHLHRYAIVKDLVIGKNILDIACGEGYGSNILSSYAKNVVGIDISDEAINHAKKKYKKHNLQFKQGSATFIDLPDTSIDIIISFETIEHLKEHDEMLQQFKKVLKRDGILIISSPDKKNYSDKPGYANPFHLKELYKNEFEILIKKYFENTVMLFQKSAVASIITTDIPNNKKLREFEGDYFRLTEIMVPADDAMFNICLASSEKLEIEKLKFDSVFYEKSMNDFYFNNTSKYFELQEKNYYLQNQLNSYSYKIGRVFTFPFRFIKRKFFSKNYTTLII